MSLAAVAAAAGAMMLTAPTALAQGSAAPTSPLRSKRARPGPRAPRPPPSCGPSLDGDSGVRVQPLCGPKPCPQGAPGPDQGSRGSPGPRGRQPCDRERPPKSRGTGPRSPGWRRRGYDARSAILAQHRVHTFPLTPGARSPDRGHRSYRLPPRGRSPSRWHGSYGALPAHQEGRARATAAQGRACARTCP